MISTSLIFNLRAIMRKTPVFCDVDLKLLLPEWSERQKLFVVIVKLRKLIKSC